MNSDEQEIANLTAELRAGPHEVFAQLRRALINEGISPEYVVLIEFVEGDDGLERGICLVDTRVYEFEKEDWDVGAFSRFEDCSNGLKIFKGRELDVKLARKLKM